MAPLNEAGGTKKDLILYRLQTAKGNLKSARILLEAEEIRHASDYDDFYIASREEAERQASAADEFIQMAENYCMTQLKESEEDTHKHDS